MEPAAVATAAGLPVDRGHGRAELERDALGLVVGRLPEQQTIGRGLPSRRPLERGGRW